MTLRNKALMKNIEQVGYHDLQKRPAFQIVMQKCGRKILFILCILETQWLVHSGCDGSDESENDSV